MNCKNYIPDYMTVEECIELANPVNYWLVATVIVLAIGVFLAYATIKVIRSEYNGRG